MHALRQRARLSLIAAVPLLLMNSGRRLGRSRTLTATGAVSPAAIHAACMGYTPRSRSFAKTASPAVTFVAFDKTADEQERGPRFRRGHSRDARKPASASFEKAREMRRRPG
jgi:hypothetical protein